MEMINLENKDKDKEKCPEKKLAHCQWCPYRRYCKKEKQ